MTTVRQYLAAMYNPAMLSSGQVGLLQGQVTAGASWAANATSITLAQAAPSWVVANMNVYDVTNGKQVGTISAVAGSTLTISAAANASQGSSDLLQLGLTPVEVQYGYDNPTANNATVGVDVRGIVDICTVKMNEVAALMTLLQGDALAGLTAGSTGTGPNLTMIGNIIAAI